jgi:hypothetical protein
MCMLFLPNFNKIITVKTEKIIVWIDNFLNSAKLPQYAPIALPQRENHIFRDTTCKINESVPVVELCHKSDQLSIGSKHQITIAPNKLKA